MDEKDMKSLTVGDILIYNDGRPGHQGVRAVVLMNTPSSVTVQFEDRANTTTIRHDETGWTKHLTQA